jgi:methionyl-tRNA formyltransferase
MERRPDTGDIVAQRAVAIADDDTALTLNRKLGDAARALLRDVFPLVVAGTAPRVPQDHARATTYGGRRPEDGRIAWTQSARDVCNLVRAVTHPYPGAFTSCRGERLFVWSARPDDGYAGEPGRVVAVGADGPLVAAETGAVRLARVQLDGAREETGAELAARLGLVPGDRLGDGPC